MELQSCMKAVISAINQHKTNQNDEAIHSCLLRQLDVLIGITSKKPLASFNPGELLLNQCLAAVISTLSDSHIKFLIAQKILTLFNNLVNSNVVCSILQNSFDLFGTLLDYFKLCSNPPHDLNMQLCIKVLQKITYKKQVVITLSKIEELLNYLLIHLEFQDDGTKYRLGLLSNLTFKTPIIQSFIKSKENLKAILKKLMSYMSNSNSKIQIFAISILSNLCLHDEVGNKIFTGQNLSQMFHFLFNVLFISKSGTTQQHATDLFINIISNQRICDQLTEYSHLPQCLQLVSNILTPSLQNHRAVLELLSSFSSVPKLKRHICNLLFDNPTCQDPSIGLESILAQERSCFFFSLIATVIRDDHSISILCLDLILSLCCENSEFLKRNGRLDILVPALTRVLFSSQSSDGCSKTLKLLRATQILKMLSSVTDIIRDYLDIEICLDLIHSHIECLDGIFLSSSLHSVKINKNDMNLQSFLKHSEINQEDNNFGKPCHELVLQLVDFLTMYHIDDERVQDILEDSRFMPFIVNGLTSVTKECILISLKILHFIKTEHFSFNLLLDFMLKTNQQHHKPGSDASKRFPNNLHPFEICSVSSSESSAKAIPRTISQNSDVNEMIASLIERVRCNAEIKDFKTSEIMSIYEFKLQDLQSKEKVLQDLLDARSETLNQSEKVLSELKLRLAQHEAEAQNLRLLVLDSEKRKDELNDKVSKQTGKIESLQAEHDVIRRENSRLSEVEKSFKALSLNYSGVSQKLESCQRSLESLKQDHQALSEMDEMLKKRHETLRDQHKALASKLASVEDEKSLLSIELKENGQRITDLTRALACCEDELKKKSTECEELESSMEKLQTELSRNVQSNKDLQHQVSSMELLCHQREVIIKEKDSLINQYKKELDNYVQAAALFHKLTSGTNKSDS